MLSFLNYITLPGWKIHFVGMDESGAEATGRRSWHIQNSYHNVKSSSNYIQNLVLSLQTLALYTLIHAC